MINLLLTILLFTIFIVFFSGYMYTVFTIAAGVVIGNFIYHKLLG